eukprot:1403783-Rhodomonas_salina.2
MQRGAVSVLCVLSVLAVLCGANRKCALLQVGEQYVPAATAGEKKRGGGRESRQEERQTRELRENLLQIFL